MGAKSLQGGYSNLEWGRVLTCQLQQWEVGQHCHQVGGDVPRHQQLGRPRLHHLELEAVGGHSVVLGGEVQELEQGLGKLQEQVCVRVLQGGVVEH